MEMYCVGVDFPSYSRMLPWSSDLLKSTKDFADFCDNVRNTKGIVDIAKSDDEGNVWMIAEYHVVLAFGSLAQ